MLLNVCCKEVTANSANRTSTGEKGRYFLLGVTGDIFLQKIERDLISSVSMLRLERWRGWGVLSRAREENCTGMYRRRPSPSYVTPVGSSS